MFFSFLKKIDMYRLKINLEIESSRLFKTTLGGFLTLLHLTLSLFLFFSLGSDMINRNNPNVLLTDSFNRFPDRLNFTKDSFFFMVGLKTLDTFQQFYDPSLYTISLINGIMNKGDSKNKEIPLARCNERQIPDSLRPWFIHNSGGNVSNMLCVDSEWQKKTDSELFIQGGWDNELFAYTRILIKECKNYTNHQICKTQSEIHKKLRNVAFSFYSI